MNDCIDHGCKGYGLGYATAWVTYAGRKVSTTKHRKVYYMHTGEWPEVVRHKCDNPRCINPEHLEGGTHLDNMQDMVVRGRAKQPESLGTLNGRARLDESTVKYLRQMFIKGDKDWGVSAIAKRLGMGTSPIHRMLTGAAWSHVK